MPTYEYRCPKGHDFDVFQRISDEPGAACPDCGEPSERRITGGAGFLLKGEGFYKTDYRSDDYKKKASSEQSDSSVKEPSKSEDSGSSSSPKPSSSNSPSPD